MARRGGRGRRARTCTRLVAGLAVLLLLLLLLLPAAAGPATATASREMAAPAREAARAKMRIQVGRNLRQRTAAAGPVQAAAEGDLVTLSDPLDPADPRGDIRDVGVRHTGVGRLLFTMRTEQFTSPDGDPAWLAGSAGAFWGVDTSGDDEVDVIVEEYTLGSFAAGDVFDATTGTLICRADFVNTTVPREYGVEIQPGCFGDVKQAGVVGLFVYGTGGAAPVTDVAPDDGIPVRFSYPDGGVYHGSYAIVGTGGAVQTAGAYAPLQCLDGCPGGPPLTAPVAQQAGFVPPVVGIASGRPFDPALWFVTSRGRVHTQSGGEHHGDASGVPLAQPIVGMAVLPDRSGYWLVGRDGGVFAYGNAKFYGSTGGIRLTQPVVGMASSPTGLGYWLVAADGGIFAYGDATFRGSMGGQPLNKPVVGMAPGITGLGYWLVGADGGVFSFGLPFYGSAGGIRLQQPIAGVATTRSGGGYRFVARDGGIFAYGDADFYGPGGTPGRTDVVGITSV